MAKPKFKKYDGSGVCDVCLTPVGPKEAYLVPVATFYGSAKYKLHVLTLTLGMGGGAFDVDAHMRTMLANDPTEFSAVCEDCVSMFT